LRPELGGYLKSVILRTDTGYALVQPGTRPVFIVQSPNIATARSVAANRMDIHRRYFRDLARARLREITRRVAA
jgi:hypothetical protein